ncbi:MAG: MurT ligase domain-containing protein, partial [Candidatus Gastranaerophilales bacterium]|nr:MurT ligase domain-containing protein [Candidatus Gastranaerophilales bacterium]
YILLVIARLIKIAINMRGKSSGTSFIGMIMLKISPNFLRYTSNYIKREKIAVTGTNGKTTTAGVLSHLLETNGNTVIHNEKGANMLTGIANTMALSIYPFKRFDYAVLESDEAYLSKLYDYLETDYLIVTNLFRDQLDRYGELNTTAVKIQDAIDKIPGLKLILNADDPIVVNFKTRNNIKPVFFGFENIKYMEKNIESKAPMELFNCSHCGEVLKYTKIFYAQQGHYYCKCGYKRPECDYIANAEIYNNYSVLNIIHSDKEYRFITRLTGVYNAYNVLASVVTAMELGYENIQEPLDSYKSVFGRCEVKNINGHKATVQLIKNPTGASEVLKTVDLSSDILIIINDNYADGRDVSWLWDTDFELLKDSSKRIITSGTRAYDMAARLKYAGVEDIKVIPNIHTAMHTITREAENDITILPTYTALLELQGV